jgi:acyl-CoA synthetase (NDP forming)
VADLDRLFHPRAIAVVGATDTPRRANTILYQKVVEKAVHEGADVFPVNPKLERLGERRCYPSVTDIPGDIDVAVVMVSDVEGALRECVAKDVGFVIIFTAGFSEVGPEGAERERRLMDIVRGSRTRIFGPNTNVNALEVIPALDGPKIALITQSGHQGRPIVQGVEIGIGLSYWAPTGNELDLECADFLSWFVDDPGTAAVAGYIEGFRDIGKLRDACAKAIGFHKPFVCVKVGRTDDGARMAMSHTGHLTGSDKAFDAFARQWGIVRVDDLDELLETSGLFAKLGRPSGDGVCVYAISGGSGAHVADLFAGSGLRLPRLSDDTQKRLRACIPDYLTVENPVDNGAQAISAGHGPAMLRAIMDDPSVHVVVCPITGVLASLSGRIADELVEAASGGIKPVVAIWGSPVTDAGYDRLVAGRLPIFRTFRSCAAALRRYFDYHAFVRDWTPPPVIAASSGALAAGAYDEVASKALLARAGIGVPRETVVHDVDAAVAAADDVGYPVVLKGAGPGHKSELGLVELGIGSASAVRDAYERITGTAALAGVELSGVVVAEQVSDGVETLVGMSRDAQFGPVIAFGLGGVAVEALGDVALGIAPLSERDVERMIDSIRGRTLLDGFRGRPAVDRKAIVHAVLAVSELACAHPEIDELDVNPLLVMEKGAVALDALVVVGDREAR